MTNILKVGGSEFRVLRESGACYVDKTRLLTEFLDNGVMVTMITRPRRFGKSLMLSTIEEFLSICNDKEETRRLFDGLEIMEQEDLVQKYMGKYPVLHFSFDGIKGNTYEELMDSILAAMQNWCMEHIALFDFDKCDEDDVELFKRIKKEQANKQYDGSEKGRKLKEADMESFLIAMMRMLFTTYDEKVVVLLDEYDLPLAQASVLADKIQVTKDRFISAYDAMMMFMSSMLEWSLKDNDIYLEQAVLAGRMCVISGGPISGFNNYSWYGIQRAGYADAFGFTPEEVEKLLSDAGMPEKMKEFKEWYDGYVFCKAEIYCPWDVLKQVEYLQENPEASMEPHWLGTSENEILQRVLRNPKINIERQVSSLLKGVSVVATINRNVTYDILDSSRENLWTILYQTGYLAKKNPSENGEDLELVIPNKEVRKVFESETISWLLDRSDALQATNIIDSLLSHNADEAARLLSKHLLESMSFFDYTDDIYHALIGMYLKRDGYLLEFGDKLDHSGIVLYNSVRTWAIIIEARHAREKKDYPSKLKEAVGQCIREKYIEGIKTKFKDVVCYGLACYQKECMMQEVTENDTLAKPRARKRQVTKKQ